MRGGSEFQSERMDGTNENSIVEVWEKGITTFDGWSCRVGIGGVGADLNKSEDSRYGCISQQSFIACDNKAQGHK